MPAVRIHQLFTARSNFAIGIKFMFAIDPVTSEWLRVIVMEPMLQFLTALSSRQLAGILILSPASSYFLLTRSTRLPIKHMAAIINLFFFFLFLKLLLLIGHVSF